MSLRTLPLLLAVLFVLFAPQPPAAAQLGAGVTTKVVLDQLSAGLKDVVNDAGERADLTVARAAIQMLGVIDAWKQANTDLLDKAFSEVDEAQRNVFANAHTLVVQFDASTTRQLETAQRLTEMTSQITENIPLGKGRTFVLRQLAEVVHPRVQDTLLLTLRGVNLDRGDPRVVIEGTEMPRSLQGPQEVRFRVPLSVLDIDTTRYQVHTIPLTYRTRIDNRFWIFKRHKQVAREITVATLPTTVGTYTLTGTRRYKEREERAHTADAGRFQASNADVHRIARPLDGWRWDMTKPIQVVSTGRGEAGSCAEIVLNNSSEHGVEIRAHLDRIRRVDASRFPPRITWGPGYSHCGAQGTVYRLVDATAEIPAVEGRLTWMEDVVVPVPDDTDSFELRVRNFAGQERIITNSYQDPDGLFSVTREPGRVILRPIVPTVIQP